MRLWRPNAPQSYPRGFPKGGQKPSKIGTKSSLSRRGCLPATFRGVPPPLQNKIYRKSTEQLAALDEILAEYGYSPLLQNLKKEWRAFRPVSLTWGGVSAGRVSSGLVDLKNITTNVCSFTKRIPAKRQNNKNVPTAELRCNFPRETVNCTPQHK